ncbi:MAG: dehydrogenase, partial [Planctomycetota bacterium]|nr:dehydrogenase [Planctomycetota bacterium]
MKHFVISLLLAAPLSQAQALKLEKGDSICLIGNALAERMQHDGWLETFIQSRFPDLELSFRNMGFNGDELASRARSSNFGSPDDHLKLNKASVVFMFFGYNESWKGEEQLNAFKGEYEAQIKHLQGQNYSGKGAPRIVVVSPIA